MLGKEFRGLAEAVTGTYGSDPWFFLRELAQNSRDASARTIRVEAQRSADGLEVLSFTDDGRGMSLNHARRFLFRLYASDKAGDRKSAGKYGIGFWTVLRFRPIQIGLRSRCRSGSWAIVLDAELRPRAATGTLDRPGTRVTLTRPAAFATEADFTQAVEQALRVYCAYLRRNDRPGTPLPVFFQGRNLTAAMTLPGPLSLSFHDGPVEGAVAVGDAPRVSLFARGLPVWEGALLEQMSHLQPNPPGPTVLGQGLAPVFLLNGNRLDVTFSRTMVLENRALQDVRRRGEKALRRLLANSLETAFPMKWSQRLRQLPRSVRNGLARPGWKLLLLALLVVLPLEIVILSRFFPGRVTNRPALLGLHDNAIVYPGASVTSFSDQAAPPLTYSPAVPAWFRIFVAADYDLKNGFVRRPGWLAADPSADPCERNKSFRMRLASTGAGRTLLPVPPGYAVDPGSLIFSSGEGLILQRNVRDEYGTDVPATRGDIFYTACPRADIRELATDERRRLTALPAELALPPALSKTLDDANALSNSEKVSLAGTLVRDLLRYDASPSTARAYRQRPAGEQWAAAALAVGRGDCDVINGFHVLLLRRLGIPSRMAVGLIGSRGRILPGLHAWSEYHDNGWRFTDPSAEATGLDISPPAASAPKNDFKGAPALSDPFTEPAGSNRYLWLAIALVGTAALLTVAVVLVKRPRFVPATGASAMTADESKEHLLPLIRQALLHPEQWGRENPLWDHPLLPTLAGPPLSLRRALTSLRRGRLLVASGQNPLATSLQERGLAILDLRSKLFAPLFNLLSGAVNLDTLSRLRPQSPGESKTSGDGLLSEVNRCLQGHFPRPTRCLLAPGLEQTDLLDVSLPAAPRNPHLFFPRRFIAVNPAGKKFVELSGRFVVNRPLAVFQFLQTLFDHSLLSAAEPERLLKKAARRLLRESHQGEK